MLTLIRSPLPGILQADPSLPEEVARVLQRVRERPEKFAWVVPTGRRKRALVQEWMQSKIEDGELKTEDRRSRLEDRGSVAARPQSSILDTRSSFASATILPRFFTLESFVAEALQFSPRQKPRVGGPERLMRVAALWHELTGRSAGPGVIHQFDRYIRDCQACGVKPSPKSKDRIDRLANGYLSGLEGDGLLDRMSSVATLAEEIHHASGASDGPGVMNYLRPFEAILIDGFHRFEPIELDLIAALGKVCDVVLWLVGIPGTLSWKTVEATTDLLKENGATALVVDWGFEESAPGTLFAEIGRRLFQVQINAKANDTDAPSLARRASSLFKLEVDSALDEVESVARQIKTDYLDSQKSDRPLRLSNVAVIIPGPAYDPLIREVFPRAGLEFNLAGRALLVSTSRPARVLLAAINLIQGRWRYDLLLDFLNQPLVRRKLDDAHRLDDLFEHRPRARQRMDHGVWSQAWKKQLERLEKEIEGLRTKRIDPPERTTLSREEYVAKQKDLKASLERLIAAIQTILTPIDAMERTIENPSEDKPLSDLILMMEEFLGQLKIDKWLSPLQEERGSGPDGIGRESRSEPGGFEETQDANLKLQSSILDPRSWERPVLWVEYEKDQNAYLKLLNILQGLNEIPAARLPKRGDNKPDVLAALKLALDGETYQIKTEDDAGVQVFELREIRGLRFRHVYVLGLVNGQIPALPEEGTLVRRRLGNERLREQLNQKEAEVQYHFCQVFEAAQEKLVLSRFKFDGDRPALPSPFFTAVGDVVVDLPELPDSQLVTTHGQAARFLGRASKGDRSLSHLWPGIPVESAVELEPALTGLTAWRRRLSAQDLVIDWPEMLQVLFPDDYEFSPSQLETYAACPFRFFGSRVLHLEEREADQTRLQYGSLVHRVVHLFYEEKRKQTRTPADQPLPAISRNDRDRLIQLFEEQVSLLDEGVLTPDLSALFVGRNGVIDLFLSISETLEGQTENFGNLLTEYTLEQVALGKDASGRPLFLTGKIDRVDVKRSNVGVAIILDYKTGSSPPHATMKTKVVDGRMMQLPLYAAALEITRAGLHVIGAAYVHLNEKAKSEEVDVKKAVMSLGQLLPGKKEPDPELWNTRRAVEIALDFAGRIRAGQFPLTRHAQGSDQPECTAYCPLRHACRHSEGYTSLNRKW